MNEVMSAVGRRIRRLRQAQGLSLSELARRSNVGKATLSKIESGEANPRLETLLLLSEALRHSLGQLLAEETREVNIVRCEEGAPIVADFLDARYLQKIEADGGRIEVMAGGFRLGGVHESPPHAPGVVEHLIATSNRLRAGPAGQEEVIGPGDYLRFQADAPHSYEALDGEARFVALMQYPPATLHGRD